MADAERRTAAIMYAELRNFTRLSEVLPPDKVLELANEFFSFCAIAVTANKGKVLSVQNDALIAAFAAAQPSEFAARALKAARSRLNPSSRCVSFISWKLMPCRT